jgi:hypothetical protein
VIDEVNLLCDRLERLIDDARSVLHSEASREKAEQLREVRNVISRLRSKGVDAPEPLVRLHDELSEEDQTVQVARATLTAISDRLVGLVAKAGSPRKHAAMREPAPKSVRVSRAAVAAEYEAEILDALRKLGGHGTKRQVLGEMLNADALQGSGEDGNGNGMTRHISFDALAQARQALVSRGILRKDSPRGLWELADDGRADND